MKRSGWLSLSVFLYFLLIAFRPSSENKFTWGKYNEKLSEYGFFKGKLADMLPAEDVLPYTLNSPLFSDYAYKARFVRLPAGKSAIYDPKEVFEFPVGTVLIKTFYYSNDFRDESKGRRILETRLLIREEKGWVALPYIWNEAQSEATLEVAGGEQLIYWKDQNGKKQSLNYGIPNMNQCKGCHNTSEVLTPIGPNARQLNGDFFYSEGKKNQLLKWTEKGILSALPNNLADVPKIPVWDQPDTGDLNSRARAYLEINCAHCHKINGPASTSGLFLEFDQKNPTALGILKPPVAAGRGSGDRKFGIAPGDPDASILLHRMLSTDPGVMMPELSRKLLHKEGVQLIRQWIKEMK